MTKLVRVMLRRGRTNRVLCKRREGGKDDGVLAITGIV